MAEKVGGVIADSKPAQEHPDFKIIMAPKPWVRDAGHTVPGLMLCGAIVSGAADWRDTVAKHLRTCAVTILNPVRPDWDSTWREDISFEPFREQVQWELNMMERADFVAVYFASSTDAPISLLELGLLARNGKANVVVCCEKGYKKRGNVQAVCARYLLEVVETVTDLVKALQQRLEVRTGGQKAELSQD